MTVNISFYKCNAFSKDVFEICKNKVLIQTDRQTELVQRPLVIQLKNNGNLCFNMDSDLNWTVIFIKEHCTWEELFRGVELPWLRL